MLNARRRLAAGVLLAAAAVLAVNCGDDPTAPTEDLWVDVALPTLGHSTLVGIAAHGTRALTLALDRSTAPPFARAVQSTGGAWQLLTLPGVPAGAVFLGVGFDTGGYAAVAGGTLAGQPIVLDERTGWSVTTLPGDGFLQALTAGSGDSLEAVGTANGGLSAVRSIPGVWDAGRAGFTTPQKKSLVDVTFADGTFIACGWDDSSSAAVLRSLDAAGWKPFDAPGTVDIPEVHSEYRAVWLDAGGALWLGGTSIDGTGAVPVYTARLARRPPSGDWFEIVLPDAHGAEAVNDILRASDGSVYLACGESHARVLRWDGMTWQDEQPAILGQFLGLAETSDGSVYAAGVRIAAPGQERPLLRRRRPS